MVEVVIKLNEVIAYICQNNCAVKDPRIICGFQCIVNNALSEKHQLVNSTLIYISVPKISTN